MEHIGRIVGVAMGGAASVCEAPRALATEQSSVVGELTMHAEKNLHRMIGLHQNLKRKRNQLLGACPEPGQKEAGQVAPHNGALIGLARVLEGQGSVLCLLEELAAELSNV